MDTSSLESKFIEVAQGNLACMWAMRGLVHEFGEASMLHTLLPAIEKKGLQGKALGEYYYKKCKGEPLACGTALCPLLQLRPAQPETLPPL